jgi:hypothetical protein
MILNKNNKIALNYLLGITLSVLLFWSIGQQIHQQLSTTSFSFQLRSHNFSCLLLAVFLMPLNLFLESKRWQLVSSKAQNISNKEALQSVLCGIAFSIITPNRVGEYPGRIIFLKKKNLLRLIAVSVLAVLVQMMSLIILGGIGLMYHHSLFPKAMMNLLGVIAIALFLFLFCLIFFFEKWMNGLARFSFFKRWKTYSYLLQKFTAKEQLVVLAFSFLRLLVFSTQLVLLLRWNEIALSFQDGLLLAFVFFLFIAVIPSFAFAELGIRGKLSLILFLPFTSNALGIIMATFGLWCINLLLPALAGYFILLKNRLLVKK